VLSGMTDAEWKELSLGNAVLSGVKCDSRTRWPGTFAAQAANICQ
jgi:hypothetical protein